MRPQRRHAPDEVAVYRRTARKLTAAGQLVSARLAGSGEGLVAVLDLDGFGHINERYGVALGDVLLVRIEASLVKAVAGRGDACALGGDQFVVVQPGAHDPATMAATILRSVRRSAVRTPLGRRVWVTATAGLARWPAHGRTGGEVLAAAAQALRLAKASEANERWAEIRSTGSAGSAVDRRPAGRPI